MVGKFSTAFISLALLISRGAQAAHSVSSSNVLGVVSEANANRDSCNSVVFRSDAALWTCRDTQPLSNGLPALPVTANTAAWSAIGSDGTPSLTQTGPSDTFFYPLASDECPTYGDCSDGSRWVGWPNAAPLVTLAYPNGDTGAYTWVDKQNLKGLSLLNTDFPVSLYYVEYQPTRDGDNLPKVTLVNEEFWGADDVPFGSYGSVVVDNVAYLYGQKYDGTVALAQVATDSVTDQTKYQYYVNGAWTSTKPARNDTAAQIPNAGAGGQGTFYYSTLWSEYVWIGGSTYPGATFLMTTAPAPEGPWETPYTILTEKGGDGSISAYSLQAHPGLANSNGQDMYLSFTNTTGTSSGDIYNTPLIHITWGS